MNKTLLTQEGAIKLQVELKDLKEKRDHLIGQIEEVAQPDESGEDGLATQLKEELEVIYDKIDKIEETLEVAEIITDKKQSFKTVQVGASVKIKISGNSVKEFHIVNQMESDPTINKISDTSPLGSALLGKKVDDEIEVLAPVGKITYKIVSIG
ncbi:MAG TPA: GreA/GreB family elongation factor [Candidatus Woesebacteria bacterium]|nr:GreA/GreB family elongation factor [Candidatus Woesebacteria bacterium]HPJ16949.1 GreA/GreB family elongation factor [Candidatus Woesebacteria bacterium]